MCNGNSWTIACANVFGINEARVICRQLGFNSNYMNYTQHVQIIESRATFDDQFEGCSGCEASLAECQVQRLGDRERRGLSSRSTCQYQAAVQCGGICIKLISIGLIFN